MVQVDASCGPALFLEIWRAWKTDPCRPRLLHYVAACRELTAWCALHKQTDRFKPTSPTSPTSGAAELGPHLWGIKAPGWHRIALDGGQVLLTLVPDGDAGTVGRKAGFLADTLVLTRPPFFDETHAHWWKAVARLCRRSTRIVIGDPHPDTVAGTSEARWMLAAGFRPSDPSAEEAPHFSQATFDPAWEPRNVPALLQGRGQTEAAAAAPGRCVVIGAGMAGAAVAASLARRGWTVTVFDSAPAAAAGASSLPAGVFAPAFSADDNPLTRLSRAGVRCLTGFAQDHLREGMDWMPSGVLQRLQRGPAASGQAAAFFRRDTAEGWSEPADAALLAAAGLDLQSNEEALWHIHAGWMRPAKLVAVLLAQPGITLRCGVQVGDIERDQAGMCRVLGMAGEELAHVSLVVVAAGFESGRWLGPDVALQKIAGQVTLGACRADVPALASETAGSLRFPVNGHGSFLEGVPSADGGAHWLAGASFEARADADADADADEPARIAAAQAENLARLAELLPAVAQRLATQHPGGASLGAWRGVRGVAPDRLPLVGPLGYGARGERDGPADGGGAAVDNAAGYSAILPAAGIAPGVWACTALGSRGLSLGLLCAEVLAAALHREPPPVEPALAHALCAARFGRQSTIGEKSSYAYLNKRETKK